MRYALLEQPNIHGEHFYRSRRNPIKACIVHISAGLQDVDMVGEDHSDQGLFNYLRTVERRVSWHFQADTDSWRWNLPSWFTAFQVSDYNSATIGGEICLRLTDWRLLTPAARRALLLHFAEACAPEVKRLGIPLRKATKDEIDRAIQLDLPPVGFGTHHELDPDRRTDPGWVWINGKLVDTFPWDEFFAICREVLGETATRAFPLAEHHYFGRPRPDKRCHSGYYSARDRERLQRWQLALKAKGSRVNTDGRFTLLTLAVVLWHQRKHRMKPNGLLGKNLWDRTVGR